jgi:Swt1-like HEPN
MKVDSIYDFAFRGLLAEEALDRAGRPATTDFAKLDAIIAERLSLDLLDETFVASAKQMAAVYAAIAAFENSARKLISTVLLAQVGENWWETAVSGPIRKKAETRRKDEQKIKFHAQRGDSPIIYTDLGDLGNIIGNNWGHFEAYIPTIEWAKSVFNTIELSRNVIMHSGVLELGDIERVGINIRDWIKQVGA